MTLTYIMTGSSKSAIDVVKQQTGFHPSHVFTFNRKPTTRMLNTAWIRARKSAGLPSDPLAAARVLQGDVFVGESMFSQANKEFYKFD